MFCQVIVEGVYALHTDLQKLLDVRVAVVSSAAMLSSALVRQQYYCCKLQPVDKSKCMLAAVVFHCPIMLQYSKMTH